MTLVSLIAMAGMTLSPAPFSAPQSPAAEVSAALAPVSLAGKTISFDYSSATCHLSCDGGETWRVDTESSDVSYQLSAKPNKKKGVSSEFGDGKLLATCISGDDKTPTSYTYTKTGQKTATLVFPGYEWENTYTLHFQTANSGIAICTGSAEADSWKQINIKFTIK